jgi:hypothetical protein
MDLVDIVAGNAEEHMVAGIDYSLFKNPLVKILQILFSKYQN